MNSTRLYLDTSAYIDVLLGGNRARTLGLALPDATVLSSVLLIAEARRTLVRLAREGTLAPEDYSRCTAHIEADLERFELRDVSIDVCVGPLPAVLTPRSLDLIHLWTALWFHKQAPLLRFITFDAAQQRAARELGLPID